jgi:photosystem II stability/assembly factor-like uncharacterized protein
MLNTSDSGVHWQVLPELQNAQLCGAQFLADGAQGWAISYQGTIWNTIDGGKTWQPQLILPKNTSNTHPGLGTTPIYSITMLPEGEQGWAVGYKGTILRTTNSGAHWELVAGGSNGWFMGVHFQVNGQKGWIVGADGLLLQTIDGGIYWEPQRSGTNLWLFDIHFADDGQTGWIAGDQGTVVRTQDAGKSWQPASVLPGAMGKTL